jgi:hypothetical protein
LRAAGALAIFEDLLSSRSEMVKISSCSFACGAGGPGVELAPPLTKIFYLTGFPDQIFYI